MQRIEIFVATCATVFARLGGLMIALIALAISIDVLTRNLFGRTVLNSFELSTYLFAVAVTFGMSFTALSGTHIRVDVLMAKFSTPLRRGLEFVAFLSMAATALIFSWFAVTLAVESLDRGVVSSSALAMPLGGPQMIWAVGFVIFAFTTALMTLRHGMCLLTGRGTEADRIGRFGQEEEAAEAIKDARQMEA